MKQDNRDVLFVLSTVKNLIPVTKLHYSHPQAVFVCADRHYIDLLETHLHKLEKVEGMSPQEYMVKAVNNEKEFAHTDTDDERERNRKETMKLMYAVDRFLVPKMYYTGDRDTLGNYDKLKEFVSKALDNQLPVYWESEKLPKYRKYSQKVVGEDFEKRVLTSEKDTLLLVAHPN